MSELARLPAIWYALTRFTTALIAWYLGGEKPHCSVIGLWEKPDNAEQGWFVPVAEVEAAIISTARNNRITVREIVFDPARWNRTFMVLDEEGLPVLAYPNSAERMVPATQKFYEAVVNESFTHDGNEGLARHIEMILTNPQRVHHNIIEVDGKLYGFIPDWLRCW